MPTEERAVEGRRPGRRSTRPRWRSAFARVPHAGLYGVLLIVAIRVVEGAVGDRRGRPVDAG